MEKADKVWTLSGMSQDDFNRAAQNLIDTARTAEEKLRCILEKDGGECPTCGYFFIQKHCSKMGSNYTFFVPGCRCFEEKKIKLDKITRGMIRGRIPQKYWEKEFDNLRFDLISPEHREKARDAFKNAREYCENRRYEAGKVKKGIYLYGAVGSGKTLSAALIARHMIREGKRVVFLSMPSFIQSILKKEPLDYIGKARGAAAVILDDFSKDIPRGEWSQNRLHELVNFLDENQKIVIVTDEIHPGKLAGIVKRSIFSRLSGLAGKYIVKFESEDFRPKEREL